MDEKDKNEIVEEKENKYVNRVAGMTVTVVAGCIMCVVVALTIKLIQWLIF